MTHVRTVFCYNCPLHIIKSAMSIITQSQRMLFSGLGYPFVLYGCETWSFTLREDCRLRVFEYRVVRRIFGPKRDKVTGQ